MSDALRDELLAEMQAVQTVDCHSHTVLRRDYYAAGPRSLFNLSSYFDRDIASVTGHGPAELYADCESDEERWAKLRGVLAKARNVTYWRHNLVAFRELFGLEGEDGARSTTPCVSARPIPTGTTT